MSCLPIVLEYIILLIEKEKNVVFKINQSVRNGVDDGSTLIKISYVTYVDSDLCKLRLILFFHPTICSNYENVKFV